MKAGGAYVPLDPMYPTDRLEFMLADVQPGRADDPRVRVEDRSRIREAEIIIAGRPGRRSKEPPRRISPTSAGAEDLAYVIYTSGSTGQPKGVMIDQPQPHERLSSPTSDEYRLRELSAHLQMASPSFDVFTGDLIRSLLAGAKLVLCPLDVVIDPARALRADGRARGWTPRSSCLPPPRCCSSTWSGRASRSSS